MTKLNVSSARPISIYDNLDVTPNATSNQTTIVRSPLEYCLTPESTLNTNNQKNSLQQFTQYQEQVNQELVKLESAEQKQLQQNNLFASNSGIISSTSMNNSLSTSTPTTTAKFVQLPSERRLNMYVNSIDDNNINNVNERRNTNSNSNYYLLNQRSKNENLINTDAQKTSQSNIAAVKAALQDAKSKFFGVNNNAISNELDNNKERQTLLAVNAHSPDKIPIKNQPKYQNIPENSEVFRQNNNNLSNRNKTLDEDKNQIGALSEHSDIGSCNKNHFLTQNIEIEKPGTKSIQLPMQDFFNSDIQPSQAVYMATTVPQNIKGTKIGGRHTPTRNSLRHSRMLVVNNRNFQEIEYANPMYLKKPNSARWLFILNIALGSIVALLGLWIFLLAPSTYIFDNPYWSGLLLIVNGICGLILTRFKRIKRHKLRESLFQILRLLCFLLILLSIILCSIALGFATIHFIRLTGEKTRCISTDNQIEQSSCTCIINAAPNSNVTDSEYLKKEIFDNEELKFEYRDFSCKEVTGEWTSILILSMVLNFIGFLINITLILLLIFYRHSLSRLYTSVQTSTYAY